MNRCSATHNIETEDIFFVHRLVDSPHSRAVSRAHLAARALRESRHDVTEVCSGVEIG